jgi:hypothetical protein
MMKLLFGAAVLGLALTAPAYADDMMKCDDATMMMMQTEMDAVTDAAMMEKKEMAMKEMEMAKTSMKDGKMDDCTMHMGEAKKTMMTK